MRLRPGPRPLERGGGLHDELVFAAPADNLQADGQSGLCQAGGHADRRISGEIEERDKLDNFAVP
jgi:hypothetical protein